MCGTRSLRQVSHCNLAVSRNAPMIGFVRLNMKLATQDFQFDAQDKLVIYLIFDPGFEIAYYQRLHFQSYTQSFVM